MILNYQIVFLLTIYNKQIQKCININNVLGFQPIVLAHMLFIIMDNHLKIKLNIHIMEVLKWQKITTEIIHIAVAC